MDVRGLSQRAMREIVASRTSGGPYRSVADLAARIKLSREEFENLALAGALDSLAGNRPRALWQVHEITKGSAAPHPGGTATLWPGHVSPDAPPNPPPCPDLADYSPLQKLLIEDHILGMTPSANPMAVYRPLMIADCGLRIADLTTNNKDQNPRPARAVRIAGILFAERRARTRTGEFMKFLSLEDETGVIEAVLMPDAYQRLGGRLTTRGPYVVTGTVEDHMGAISLIVSNIRRFHPADQPQAVAVHNREVALAQTRPRAALGPI
jgi:DNA polymerase III alpha subunit